jgi:hypothetical protein
LNLLLITLAAFVFIVSVGLIARRWQRDEYERISRQWVERERLLGRRKPAASYREVLERRARRG